MPCAPSQTTGRINLRYKNIVQRLREGHNEGFDVPQGLKQGFEVQEGQKKSVAVGGVKMKSHCPSM